MGNRTVLHSDCTYILIYERGVKRPDVNLTVAGNNYEWFLFSLSFPVFCDLGWGVGDREHKVSMHTRRVWYTEIKFRINKY